MGKLFQTVMADEAPDSLLIHGLSVCIALLDQRAAGGPMQGMGGFSPIRGGLDLPRPQLTVRTMKSTLQSSTR